MKVEQLLTEFVSKFAHHDNLNVDENEANEIEALCPDMIIRPEPDWEEWKADIHWTPVKQVGQSDSIIEFRKRLGISSLPKLYESLLRDYRWLRVDLGPMLLWGNPPISGMNASMECIFKNELLTSTLLRNHFVPFGQQGYELHDPICFNLRAMTTKGDCEIVHIAHEPILCREKIEVIDSPWASFEALVNEIIAGG